MTGGLCGRREALACDTSSSSPTRPGPPPPCDVNGVGIARPTAHTRQGGKEKHREGGSHGRPPPSHHVKTDRQTHPTTRGRVDASMTKVTKCRADLLVSIICLSDCPSYHTTHVPIPLDPSQPYCPRFNLMRQGWLVGPPYKASLPPSPRGSGKPLFQAAIISNQDIRWTAQGKPEPRLDSERAPAHHTAPPRLPTRLRLACLTHGMPLHLGP